ncbi:MAG: phosphate ABC transporter substrate-binding protein PstS [Candidatus Bathyarchaeota archaeon]|nr:phosphate ABC transporter substrate-binding protein PstS [Candidatus Bathyarchaeota archaeon]
MNTKYTIVIAIVAIAIIAGAIIAYTYNSSPSENITLNASGATFPKPFLDSTISEYSSLHTNVQINYAGGGSGQGRTDFINKVVDFAGTDAALTDDQRTQAPDALHIPETIGAITVAYNIPDIDTGLKLTGEVVANIFLGAITNWNDPAITALNPDLTLPDHEIAVVHRSEGSGTTNWFTTYLSIVSSDWATMVGADTTVEWPVGVGSSGNSGVAATIDQTEYSVGYIELAYALENDVTVAALQNPAGNFVLPSLDSTTAAAQSLPSNLPTGSESWADVHILNTEGAQAYPIVTPTYLLVYQDLSVIPDMTMERATAIVQYIWYVVHDGQDLAAPLEYAALPSNLIAINEATLNSITFNGETIPTS